jgi:hypothetical protein
MSERKLSDLQAARIEALFHRRRALALETQVLERDEAVIAAEIEVEHGLRPGEYVVDHAKKTITARGPVGPR